MHITRLLLIIQSRLNFRQIFEYSYIYILHFTQFRPAVAQLFHADRKTDRHTWQSWQSIFADIRIIDVICLSVAIQTVAIPTRHTASSNHNILLNFPHHTALKATNPSADHILLDRLTSYILCTFLFHDTSCVMLSKSSYKHSYVAPPTRPVTNQFHYQWSPCKFEPQLLLTN